MRACARYILSTIEAVQTQVYLNRFFITLLFFTIIIFIIIIIINIITKKYTYLH